MRLFVRCTYYPLLAIAFYLFIAGLVYDSSEIDCSSSMNCAVCDETKGQCSFCPPGKGWKSGNCKTLDNPQNCMYFENPNDNTLNSTVCEICANKHYLKYNGTVCERENVIASCDASCFSCKETSANSLPGNSPAGSECQLCEKDYFFNAVGPTCSSTNTTNWYNCMHEGKKSGDCYQCRNKMVSYFGKTRCDLPLDKGIPYCNKYGNAEGTICLSCEDGHGMVNTTFCKSYLSFGILLILILVTIIITM